ncbi:hypothetical protein EDD86DRAFT_247634 [Gorgonomyces haynaldii]|nr:hypothetical protein EDD86DRAFT_247634 [Gorgonomyces haynaldii]
MFELRSGDYLHPGAIFHGAGLYEGLCVVKLILARLSKDKRAIRSPIFAISVLSLILCFVNQVCYMYTVAYLERPWGGAAGLAQYFMVVKTIVVLPGLNSNLKKGVAMICMGILCVAYFGLWIALSYYGVYSMNANSNFWLAPTYATWQLFKGLSAICNVIVILGGTILFLGHIARSLNMSPVLLLREIALKHDGPRWIAMIALQLMSLSATFMGVMRFLTLYLFLESSYSAAREIVESHGASKKFGPTGATRSLVKSAVTDSKH